MDKSAASPPPPHRKGKPAPGHFRPSRVIARWWWLALVVIVCVVGIAYKLPAWFNMRGPLYESTALLEVKPIPAFDGAVTPSPTAPPGLTNAFMMTQEEIIQAPASLKLALEQKDLLNRLGGSEAEALKRMGRNLTVRQRRGTDLMEISFRDEDPLTAQDAVTAIYQSYVERRKKLELQIQDDTVKSLEEELTKQKNHLAIQRQRLKKVAQKAGLTFVEKGGEGVKVETLSFRDEVGKDLYKANRKKGQLALELGKLSLIEDGETLLLLHYESDQVTPQFTELYKIYEKTNEEIRALRVSGVGEKHPELAAKEKTLAMMKEELLKRPEAIRELLKLELKAVEKTIERLKNLLHEENGKSTQRSRAIMDFNLARREYQMAQSRVDTLQVKYDIASTKRIMPVPHHVVHEAPQRPTQPVTRGHEFFTTLFSIVSLPIAAIAAIILIYLAEAIFPRRVKV